MLTRYQRLLQMIQADEALLARAEKAASERGVTFPQLVRQALEHELRDADPGPLSCAGSIDSGGKARKRSCRPEAWR
jgi:hypothetical protein